MATEQQQQVECENHGEYLYEHVTPKGKVVWYCEDCNRPWQTRNKVYREMNPDDPTGKNNWW